MDSAGTGSGAGPVRIHGCAICTGRACRPTRFSAGGTGQRRPDRLSRCSSSQLDGKNLTATHIDIKILKRGTLYIVRQFRSVSLHVNGVLRLLREPGIGGVKMYRILSLVSSAWALA